MRKIPRWVALVCFALSLVLSIPDGSEIGQNVEEVASVLLAPDVAVDDLDRGFDVLSADPAESFDHAIQILETYADEIAPAVSFQRTERHQHQVAGNLLGRLDNQTKRFGSEMNTTTNERITQGFDHDVEARARDVPA